MISGISYSRTKPPTLSGASTYRSSGKSTAARMAAICGSVRSVGRLSVLAPSSASTRAAAGFAAGARGAGRQPIDLLVGLEEDATALRDPVHTHVEPLRLLQHGVEARRPFHARDLDAVLRAVRKPLLRVRQIVQVAAGKPDRLQEGAGVVHAAHPVSSTSLPKWSPAFIRSCAAPASQTARTLSTTRAHRPCSTLSRSAANSRAEPIVVPRIERQLR